MTDTFRSFLLVIISKKKKSIEKSKIQKINYITRWTLYYKIRSSSSGTVTRWPEWEISKYILRRGSFTSWSLLGIMVSLTRAWSEIESQVGIGQQMKSFKTHKICTFSQTSLALLSTCPPEHKKPIRIRLKYFAFFFWFVFYLISWIMMWALDHHSYALSTVCSKTISLISNLVGQIIFNITSKHSLWQQLGKILKLCTLCFVPTYTLQVWLNSEDRRLPRLENQGRTTATVPQDLQRQGSAWKAMVWSPANGLISINEGHLTYNANTRG